VLGHLASLVPIGDIAWRVHMTSALFHAVAVGVVADTVRRLTGSWVAAAGASLGLTLSGLFFLGSLYAEAFPLNDLMTAVVLGLGLAVDRAHRALDVRATWRRLMVLVIAAGVASTHHQMIALTAPALAVLIWPATIEALHERLDRVALLVAIFLGILACGYAVVFLASAGDPRVNWGDVHSAGDIASLFLRRDYGGPFSAALHASTTGDGDRIVRFLWTTARAMGFMAMSFAAIGAFEAWRQDRRTFIALLLAALATGPAFAAINALPTETPAAVAFVERFFPMAHVSISLLVGVGVAGLERRLLGAGFAAALVQPGLGVLAVVPLLPGTSRCDLSNDRMGAARVSDLLSGTEPDSLVLVAGDALISAATYTCAVDERCTTRAVFSAGQLHMDWRIRQLSRWYPGVLPSEATAADVVRLIAHNLPGRPVYIAPGLLGLVPGLRDAFAYVPQMLLLRVLALDDQTSWGPALASDGRAMLTQSGGCSGCDPRVAATAATRLDRPLIENYVTAVENHARFLRQQFDKPEDAALLEDRARLLRGL
jgi:hypothetical protein